MEIMFKKYIFFIPILLLEILWCLSNVNESYLKYYNHVSSQLSNSLLNFIERSMSTHKHNNEEFVILARCLGKDNPSNSARQQKKPELNQELMKELKNRIKNIENPSPSSVEYNTDEDNNDDQPTTSNLTQPASSEKKGLFRSIGNIFTRSEPRKGQLSLNKTDIGAPVAVQQEDLKKALSHDKFRVEGMPDHLRFKTHPKKTEVSHDEHLPHMPSESYTEPPHSSTRRPIPMPRSRKSPTEQPTPMPRSRKLSIRSPGSRPRQNSHKLSSHEVKDDYDMTTENEDVTQPDLVHETDNTSVVRGDELDVQHNHEQNKKQYTYDAKMEERYLDQIKSSCDHVVIGNLSNNLITNISKAVEDYDAASGSDRHVSYVEGYETDFFLYSIWRFLLSSPDNFMKGLRIIADEKKNFTDIVFTFNMIGVKSPEFYVTVNLNNNSIKNNFEMIFMNATIHSVIYETCVTLHGNMYDSGEKTFINISESGISVSVCGPGNFSYDFDENLLAKLIGLRFGLTNHLFYIKLKKPLDSLLKSDSQIVYIDRPVDVMEAFIKSFFGDKVKKSTVKENWAISLHRLPSANHTIIEFNSMIGPSHKKIVLPCWQCIIYPLLEQQMKLFFKTVTPNRQKKFIITLHNVDTDKYLSELEYIYIDRINKCITSIQYYIKYAIWNFTNDLLSEVKLNLNDIILISQKEENINRVKPDSVLIALSNVYEKNVLLTVKTDHYHTIPISLPDSTTLPTVPLILRANNNNFITYYSLLADSEH